MTYQAEGEFEVKLIPQQDREIPFLGRLSIDKVFHGEMTGTSQGQMLSAGTSVPNSAGYVAIERVEATVNGKRGTFILQHHAVMDKGRPSQSIVIIPDSGTDELSGITGQLSITIKDKKHYYRLEYKIPE